MACCGRALTVQVAVPLSIAMLSMYRDTQLNSRPSTCFVFDAVVTEREYTALDQEMFMPGTVVTRLASAAIVGDGTVTVQVTLHNEFSRISNPIWGFFNPTWQVKLLSNAGESSLLR